MFSPRSTPRVFCQPLGCDFLASLVAGLSHRLENQPPEAIARVEIFLNTKRAARRLRSLLQEGPAGFLPRIRLISDLTDDPLAPVELAPAIPRLRRELLISQLVRALLKKEPDLAPLSAVFDLTASLTGLLDEMQWENVNGQALENASDLEQSAYWHRSLKFLRILTQNWQGDGAPDPEERLRNVINAYAGLWQNTPPDNPILVAGSTGSRGSTAALMQAVAKLPNGAVILPGVDQDLPSETWEILATNPETMEHPQAAIARLCNKLGCRPNALPVWQNTTAYDPERNKVISLALRPAPVTDQWVREGRKLANTLSGSMKNISLLEAANQKEEANAIALCLRQALAAGKSAALISPDRSLTRRVAVSLKRWNIVPDDSAGRPLALTPPGVFLRLTANLFGTELTPGSLMALLKHPLTHTGGETRGEHLLKSRDLENTCLRGGPPIVSFVSLKNWADAQPDRKNWFEWLENILEPLPGTTYMSLEDWLRLHRKLAETLSQGHLGHDSVTTGSLWQEAAGEEAARIFALTESNCDAGGDLTFQEYRALIATLLNQGEVRNARLPHPELAILGTLEARVQSADLVILGGLNEGVWPKSATPDPWLSRVMRKKAGLPLPEQKIGLSAHDFQQAAAASQVVLSRSLRAGDAPAVASRWLTRLTNLLGGLGDQGKAALDQMTRDAAEWISLARALDRPLRPAPRALRPAPAPPVSMRPDRLSVTRIARLIQDPYAIYAETILHLKPLDPLGRDPDPMMRGTAIHSVLEQFSTATTEGLDDDAVAIFQQIATEVMAQTIPWQATQKLWLARLERVSQSFIEDEVQRRLAGQLLAQECKGTRELGDLNFTLSAKADRIDISENGQLLIYDYKSGGVPTKAEVNDTQKQLQLEAAIAAQGGFEGINPASTTLLEYIGLGGQGSSRILDSGNEAIETCWQEFRQLMGQWALPDLGYFAHGRKQNSMFPSDYDHLARYGEWQSGDLPVIIPVGEKDNTNG